MKNKQIFLGAAVLVVALATIQSAAGISIEGGANANVASSGGSASGGQFLEDNSHVPTPGDFDRSTKWSISAGIYADASIPEGATGQVGYSFKRAKNIAGLNSIDIGYDGTVMAKVSKESLDGSAEAHSRVDATGTRYFSGESSEYSQSGSARIFSEIYHTGIGTALAEATGTASYSVPSEYPIVNGMASGRTSISSASRGNMGGIMSTSAHGIAEISQSSFSARANDPFPWGSIRTHSTIYSNVEASRHPSIGSVQVDGYAKGKASGLAVGDIADPTYPWDWIGMELNTTSLGTVKVSARLVHPSEHESASKEITSSRAV